MGHLKRLELQICGVGSDWPAYQFSNFYHHTFLTAENAQF